MLFNYHYVHHSIATFQTWLDHLVKQVWCKPTGDYSIDLLCPELKEVVIEISNDDKIKIDHLNGPIKRIYALFKEKLDAAQREQVAAWYDANNDIEALCKNDPRMVPATYADIGAINADLEKELKAFYASLWPDVLALDAIKSRLGSIDDHYRIAFLSQNKEEKCPYCGYRDLMGENHRYREAYDHYLPKGVYPFNVVNFKNLAPMCDRCNSKYKLAKDPTKHLDPITRKTTGQRRKAFYSYSTVPSGITIIVNLKNSDVANLRKEEIELQFISPGRDEEVDAWKDIFGIEERYMAKCCAKNDGKYWFQQAFDECANVGKTPQEILDKIERNAKGSPWAECNFLKSPFLHACKDAVLIKQANPTTVPQA